MFDALFIYPAVRRRHREGPLATERAAYLRAVAAQGVAGSTLLRVARYCLCVATELQRQSLNHSLEEQEVKALAQEWAAQRVKSGRATGPRWATENFEPVARGFLRSCGRLRLAPARPPGRYEAELADFLAAQQEDHWHSTETCKSAMWQVRRFLNYLEGRNIRMSQVVASDIDAYFRDVAGRWSRSSLRTSATMLRAWFTHAEKRGWGRPGLAKAILMPRLYRQEGLSIGPTWEQVGRMLQATAGQDPASLRDHAVLLLLSVYGIRSGEVRRLRLDDIDWAGGQIRIVRSKSGLKQALPLNARVGNAIVRYLRHGRPTDSSRILFLTLKAPYVALSTARLYNLVNRHLAKVSPPIKGMKGRGPHALRHACAQHLLDTGRTFKEVGDHLGHHSPDSTGIYAKVNLAALRHVAFNDLGGLS